MVHKNSGKSKELIERISIIILLALIILMVVIIIITFPTKEFSSDGVPDLFIYIPSSEKLNVSEGFLSLPNFGINKNGGICWFVAFFMFEFHTHHSKHLIASLRYYQYLLDSQKVFQSAKYDTARNPSISKIKKLLENPNATKFLKSLNKLFDVYFENLYKGKYIEDAQRSELEEVLSGFISNFFDSEEQMKRIISNGFHEYYFFVIFIKEMKKLFSINLSKFWKVIAKRNSEEQSMERVWLPRSEIMLTRIDILEGGSIILEDDYFSENSGPLSFEKIINNNFDEVGEEIFFEVNWSRVKDLPTLDHTYIKNMVSDFMKGSSNFSWKGRNFRGKAIYFHVRRHIFCYQKGSSNRFLLIDSYRSEETPVYLDIENLCSNVECYKWDDVKQVYLMFQEF